MSEENDLSDWLYFAHGFMPAWPSDAYYMAVIVLFARQIGLTVIAIGVQLLVFRTRREFNHASLFVTMFLFDLVPVFVQMPMGTVVGGLLYDLWDGDDGAKTLFPIIALLYAADCGILYLGRGLIHGGAYMSNSERRARTAEHRGRATTREVAR